MTASIVEVVVCMLECVISRVVVATRHLDVDLERFAAVSLKKAKVKGMHGIDKCIVNWVPIWKVQKC
jgi:hypothetical protein